MADPITRLKYTFMQYLALRLVNRGLEYNVFAWLERGTGPDTPNKHNLLSLATTLFPDQSPRTGPALAKELETALEELSEAGLVLYGKASNCLRGVDRYMLTLEGKRVLSRLDRAVALNYAVRQTPHLPRSP